MNYHEIAHVAGIAKHTPSQLPTIAHEVRTMALQWESLHNALAGCDIRRIDGRITLTLCESVTLDDLYVLDVL